MNLKIKVNNEAESEEVKRLCRKINCIQVASMSCRKYPHPMYICFGGVNYKEITLPELRALVFLHKNPINMDKVLSGVRSDALGLLDGAKEYLVKTNNGYSYTMASKCWNDNWIEIPEGAIKARFYPLDPYGLEFENDKQQWWDDEEQSWVGYGLKEYAGAEKHSRIVWQRHSQPEELPFVDDEPKYTDAEVKYMDENGQGRLQSINDQYAEIEQVRQAAYNTQIGGSHYKNLAIQPMEYALKNKLDYAQANVVKYVTRHALKGGKDDLLKAIHNIELMIEHYYGE